MKKVNLENALINERESSEIFCCSLMAAEFYNPLTPLSYNPLTQSYSARGSGYTPLMFSYCPFCGKSVSLALRSAWPLVKKNLSIFKTREKISSCLPGTTIKSYVELLYVKPKPFLILKEAYRTHLFSLFPHQQCCAAMAQETQKSPQSLLKYTPSLREYGFKIMRSTSYLPLTFCIFCAQKLPESLRDYWATVLSREYGISDPDFLSKDMPHEFKTAQWWISRNL